MILLSLIGRLVDKLVPPAADTYPAFLTNEEIDKL